MTTKNYGAGASGYLDPSGRSFETTVYQAAKPVLDKELNFIQDVSQDMSLMLQRKSFPSGWISDDFLNKTASGLYNAQVLTANIVQTPALCASVNGWVVNVTNTAINNGLNNIDLGACPSGVAAKSSDLVILEVWRRLIPAAPTTTGKSSGGRIWRNGNVKVPSADDLTLNYADDLLDGNVGAETTKRVQIQYRLRTINNIDIFTYAFGINSPSVVARSVPASAAAPDGSATLFTFSNQAANGDPGLWRAGDGDPANTLGTVDGYMYALPLMVVFRRNTTAYARNTNQNGGVTYPTTSTRPDNYWSDIIESKDLLDLRTGVAPTGWDLNEVLQKNVNLLFDNENQTEVSAITPGGGSHGHTVMWADEIGISNANGGDGTTTGSTPGGTLVGEFDAVRRNFSDRAVYELVVLRFDPNSAGVSPGGATWTTSTTITISPSSLPIWPYASPLNWSSRAPSGVSIVDLHRAVYVGSSGGQIALNAQTHFQVSGLGAVPQGSITVSIRSLTDGTNTATNETLYLTLLVAYPPGVGLSKTPTKVFSNNAGIPTVSGVFINNPAQLPAGSPILYSSLVTPTINAANREVLLEYTTLSHTFSYRPGGGTGNNIFYLPERPVAGTVSVTVNGSPYGGSITVDQYTITLDTPITSGADIVFTYQSRRALPQNGEQLTVYYETRQPQTVREALLPASLSLTSKLVAQHMFVLTAGSGAVGPAYPWPLGYVQTGGVYPGSGGTFAGDHELDGDLRVSITTLYTDTGLMQLPINVPVVPAPNAVTFGRAPGDADIEGRTYYKTATGYGFLGVSSSLSDPKKHKNVRPMLCELPSDGPFGFRGQLVLVLLSRWSIFDANNEVGFVSSLASNYTTASVFRLKGNLLSNRRG
jgi:hypothetical protein